ncbi:MAG: fibrobacter succinogenes major paralogous domain-containing protein [Candidatus Fibromonas sp.]|nr:fibrobacter succinogenes major paralogous domain-containing protein [Candidatus Fibromonas sp.]
MTPKHLAFAILPFALLACSGDNTVTYGGQTYKTVKIGEQVWFAENLNYDAEGSVCYDNNPDNCAKYGRLYDWETAKKVCPDGWHLPSGEEWDKLFRFVDGDKGTESPYESKTAGKYLKANSGWNKDGNGTDDYGFSALPGGDGYSDGSFYNVGNLGYWWSANENSSYHAYFRYMVYDYDGAYWHYDGKSSLRSVRCVQD